VRVNSVEFLLFFPLVAVAFYLFPRRWRWILLLVASYYFYISWNPEYIIILLAMTAIGYVSGLGLAREGQPQRKRIILALSLTACLAILFVFKYSYLSTTFLHLVSDRLGIEPLKHYYLVLPLGISFYTFQTLSYILDVYRGVARPERHAGIYALFVSFFPHLSAGPIARANQLIPQLREDQTPEYEMIVSGLQRMAWGFFKKLVIADRLADMVNTVYANPSAYTGVALLLATYAFAVQIYCDFSGYADIAIGAARVLGFKLPENFQQPYFAESIPDFWRRWHITLYNWLRDYVFYPLGRAMRRAGFSSASVPAIVIPTLLTMLASGLWHGTSWTFIIWGGLHGLYLIGSYFWNRAVSRSHMWLQVPPIVGRTLNILLTFNLVSFAWIFFRANSLADALYIVQHLFVTGESGVSVIELMPGGGYEWLIALAAILLLELVQWQQRKNGSLREVIRRQPAWLRWSAYYGLVMVILMFGKFGTVEFIYSRF
jgi:alginate O-acetyltransferase complex protein AlgI